MKKIRNYLLAGAILIVGIIISVIFSNQPGPVLQPPVAESSTSYKTIVVKNENISNIIETTGRLTAVNKIDIYAEVTGVLKNSSFNFKAGNRFTKGASLVSIDSEVYKNNLLAQKSTLLNQITLLIPDMSFDLPEVVEKWENYLEEFDFEKPLNQLPETTSARERNYLAANNIYNLYYTIKSMEATLAKYNIKAPFNGVVIKSNINPGTLVRNGQLLGEFLSTDKYELEVAVSPEVAAKIKKGQEVILESQDNFKNFYGNITRINAAIDETTQMIKVFIEASNPELKDGMYFTAKLESDELENVAKIPRSSITETSTVYVKTGNTIIEQEITIVKKDGNSAYVKGLEAGTELLAEQSDYSPAMVQNTSVSMN